MFPHRHPLVALIAALALTISACGQQDSSGGGKVSAERSSGKAASSPRQSSVPGGYTGNAQCVGCHAQESKDWNGSHHQLAMLEASVASIRGDFNNSSFEHNGKRSEFTLKDGSYYITTDDIDGEKQTFKVLYTFGVEPLQMYLIKLANGKVQAFAAAWDSRPDADGGQRWFHVYGDEYIAPDDPLHWTQLSQNWDTMCAACHSTGLRKSYDLETDSFDTTWTEINVSCEACHGLAADHLAWTKAPDSSPDNTTDKGFTRSFNERDGISWIADTATGNSKRSAPRVSDTEISACASCHSRRSKIISGPANDTLFLNDHIPALIDPGLYHADGQIDDEVYVYGSFLQSKMHAAGVTCSDCHNPHSLELRAPGQEVCLQCHEAEKFTAKEHHLHTPGSAGADCVECHMPPKTYMQVDPRHDHSLRIPRPWLSETFGTPDPCLNCHTGEDSTWSAGVLQAAGMSGGSHWSEQLAATMNQTGVPEADVLQQIVAGDETPGIVRASVLSNGLFSLHPEALQLLQAALSDPDPLIRMGAIRGLTLADAATRNPLALKALEDPVKAVRLAAVPVITANGLDLFSQEQLKIIRGAIEEYTATELLNNERPESYVNLGNLQRNLGRYGQAENFYLTAIKLSPVFVPGYINLVDLYRLQQRDSESIGVLQKALLINPEQAALHESLGLTLVRLNRIDEAIPHLKSAAQNNPDNSRYVLTYALALDATGQTGAALKFLLEAAPRFGGNREILQAIQELQAKLQTR